MEYLTPVVAQEVFDYLRPDGHRGLFGTLLGDAGQGVEQDEPVDVAAVFLEVLVEAVDRKLLRLNTRQSGHLFVSPAFWLLTTPIGLDCVTALIRARGARHDFTRHDVFRALRAAGCLVGTDASDTPRCVLTSDAWPRPLELHGLCIAPGSLPGQPVVPPFDGTLTLKKETVDGSNAG